LYFPTYPNSNNSYPNPKNLFQSSPVPNDDGGYNDPKKTFWRLPAFIQITQYNITIEPDAVAGTFSGYSEITFQLTSPSGQVPLNLAKSTVITGATLVTVNGSEVAATQWSRRRDSYDLQIIDFAFRIPATSDSEFLLLKVSYRGVLSNDMRGIYRSSYKDDNGETRTLVATNMAPTDARYVFPCIDDPARKAPVLLSVIVPSAANTFVLANTPLTDSVDLPATGNGTIARTRYNFKRTPPMPTYTIAFAVLPSYQVSQRTYVSSLVGGGSVPVSIYTRPGQKAFADFALNTTVLALDAIERALQYPFPAEIGKLDLVAIPDFAPGATENWGLIITRETALLVDSATFPSMTARQGVAGTIAHKLAQQWFGNLVTQEWWTSLWLTEGVATFWEYFIMDTVYPTWRYSRNFIAQEQQKAMAYDALDTVRPIVYNVSSPSEIAELYYPITSAKSANILRMLAAISNSDSMPRFFGSYLNQYKLTTANGDEFWTRMVNDLSITGDVTPSMLRAAAPQWLNAAGFPVVSVVTKSNGDLELTQNRFLLSGTEVPSVNGGAPVAPVNLSAPMAAPVAAPVQQRWFLPITYRISGVSQSSQVVLTADRPTSTLRVSQGQFIKLNLNNNGYYRVRYPDVMFTSIAQAMRAELSSPRTLRVFSDSDRAGFLNDALVLSSANYPTPLLQYSLVFDALTMLRNEDSYAAWAGALEGLNQLADLLQDEPCFGNFAYFMNALVQPALDRIGWGPVAKQMSADWMSCDAATLTADDMTEDPDNEMLRNMLLQIAVEYDETIESNANSTVLKLRQLWKCYSNATNTGFVLPGSLQQAVFAAQASTGDTRSWNAVLNRYRSAQNAQERLRLLRALASAKRSHMLKTLLQMTLNATEIRPQDRSIAIAAVAANPYGGRKVAWDFVRENWSALSRGSTGVGAIIQAATSHFSSDMYLRDVDNFFSAPSARVAVDNAKDLIRRNTAWLAKYSNTVCNILTSQYP
jgi:aminopeptidase N